MTRERADLRRARIEHPLDQPHVQRLRRLVNEPLAVIEVLGRPEVRDNLRLLEEKATLVRYLARRLRLDVADPAERRAFVQECVPPAITARLDRVLPRLNLPTEVRAAMDRSTAVADRIREFLVIVTADATLLQHKITRHRDAVAALGRNDGRGILLTAITQLQWAGPDVNNLVQALDPILKECGDILAEVRGRLPPKGARSPGKVRTYLARQIADELTGPAAVQKGIVPYTDAELAALLQALGYMEYGTRQAVDRLRSEPKRKPRVRAYRSRKPSTK